METSRVTADGFESNLEKVRNFNESKLYQVWLHHSFNKNFNLPEKEKCGCKSKKMTTIELLVLNDS
jgi:hypothetical protein